MVHNKAKHQSKHIRVTNVDIRKHSRVILNFTKNRNMKVLNIPLSNVNIRQHDRTSLRHTNNKKHESVKYLCIQCEYQATTQRFLKTHQQSNHEVLNITVPTI